MTKAEIIKRPESLLTMVAKVVEIEESESNGDIVLDFIIKFNEKLGSVRILKKYVNRDIKPNDFVNIRGRVTSRWFWAYEISNI
jgi:hypothetical protein